MEFDSIFTLALQSSLLLGLIHGINPCGHSWLVLAPFVYGERNGKRVFTLTSAFILGTTLACLGIGLSLGALSVSLPPGMRTITDIVTSGVLVVLGTILVIKPELLHNHDHGPNHPHGHAHDHGHSHDHDEAHHQEHHACCHTHDTKSEHIDACCREHHEHDAHHHHGHEGCCGTHDDHHHDQGHGHPHHHEHSHGGCGCSHGPKLRSVTFWGLFAFGFLNMIVPCPTVAIMYSYALDSADMFKATAVFASYAIGTAIALACVIYAIYKIANAMRTLNKPWLEPLIMRVAGVMTIAFGIYSYLLDAGYL